MRRLGAGDGGARAQTAIEFLLLGGLMLLFFTGFLFFLHERSAQATEQSRYGELAAAAELLGQEVNNANRVQDGYERIFELPATLNGEQYSVRITDGTEALFKTADQEYVVFFPTAIMINSTGAPASSGALAPGKNRITKTGGAIYVSAVSPS